MDGGAAGLSRLRSEIDFYMSQFRLLTEQWKSFEVSWFPPILLRSQAMHFKCQGEKMVFKGALR